MSLRVRLALWYGILTGVVVIVVALLAYTIHVRTHYDQIDANLDGAAEHALVEYLRAQRESADFEPLVVAVSPEVPVRIYAADGDIVAATSSAQAVPPVELGSIVEGSNAVPYDWLVRLFPLSLYDVDVGDERFGLVRGADGERWRVIAMPVPERSEYVVAMSSLESIDSSISGVRWLLVSLATAGVVVTLTGGWVLAGRALRPVRALTDTAGEIARQRSFGSRVPVKGTDELADMSATFNAMLDELASAYRMQQRFVSDASHELRAPLTTIQGNLEFLSRHRQLDDQERQEVTDETRDEANRMARLVADLLALARADAGMALRRVDVELDRLLLEVVHDARHLCRDGQSLTIDHVEPAELEGDPDRLKQLLIIVLDNAVKYTPPGGAITVSLTSAGGAAELEIRDTGVGIPPADIPRIFDRFYRADPARARDPGGTGLGLAIARWIVEQHGGSVAVSSELDVGTTVTIRLPLKPEPRHASDRTPAGQGDVVAG